MKIQVLQYDPHVQCFESSDPADLRACKSLLGAFPVSETIQVFGNAGQVGLDRELSYADRKTICLISIFLVELFFMSFEIATMQCATRTYMTGDAVRYQWYNVWSAAAAAAVMWMCIAQGKNGKAIMDRMYTVRTLNRVTMLM